MMLASKPTGFGLYNLGSHELKSCNLPLKHSNLKIKGLSYFSEQTYAVGTNWK